MLRKHSTAGIRDEICRCRAIRTGGCESVVFSGVSAFPRETRTANTWGKRTAAATDGIPSDRWQIVFIVVDNATASYMISSFFVSAVRFHVISIGFDDANINPGEL